MVVIQFDDKQKDLPLEKLLRLENTEYPESKEAFLQSIKAKKGYREQPKNSKSLSKRSPRLCADNIPTLDLHGYTKQEALQRFENFLLSQKRQRAEVILIITGKGINSGDSGPVLRSTIQNYLKENPFRMIQKHEIAPKNLGGTGAFLVYLKS